MDFHEAAGIFPMMGGKVWSGKGDHGWYKIWPSTEHTGFFYVDQIIFEEGQALEALSLTKPMREEGVRYWLENMVEDTIKWTDSEWNGKEFNYFQPIKKEKKKTIIYFIEAVGTELVKIGRGGSRLEALQTGCPFPLNYLCEFQDDIEKERQLHKRFKRDHYRGEWFYLSEDIKNYIKDKTL